MDPSALPADVAAYFTADDFARGATRAGWSATIGWLGFALDLLLLAALAFSKAGLALRAACDRVASRIPVGRVTQKILGEGWASGALFLACVALLRELVDVPGAIALHAVALDLGLSHESFASKLGHDALRSGFVVAAFVVLGAALGAVRRRFPKRWWLSVGLAAGGLLFADAMVEPLWLRLDFAPRPLEAGALRARLEGLAEAHGQRFGEIVVIDASRYGTRANAFVTGFGPTLQIVLTDTLVALGDDAAVGAVAHEIGHRRGERLPWRLAFAALGLVGLLFLVERTLRFAMARGARDTAQAFPAVLGALSVVLTLVSPARAAFGRAEETEADGVEWEERRDPEAYIAEQLQIMRANALEPAPGGLRALLADHPSPAERIARALATKAATPR